MKLIHFIHNNIERIGILDNNDNIKILDVSNFDELINKYSLDDLNRLNNKLLDIIKRSDV